MSEIRTPSSSNSTLRGLILIPISVPADSASYERGPSTSDSHRVLTKVLTPVPLAPTTTGSECKHVPPSLRASVALTESELETCASMRKRKSRERAPYTPFLTFLRLVTVLEGILTALRGRGRGKKRCELNWGKRRKVNRKSTLSLAATTSNRSLQRATSFPATLLVSSSDLYLFPRSRPCCLKNTCSFAYIRALYPSCYNERPLLSYFASFVEVCCLALF